MLMSPPPTGYGVNPINRQSTQLLGSPGSQQQLGLGTSSIGGPPGVGVPQSASSNPAVASILKALTRGTVGMHPGVPNGIPGMPGAAPMIKPFAGSNA